MKRKAIISLLLIALCMRPMMVLAQPNEYEIKAMFVYNFLKYIEWPSNMSGGSIKIAVDEKSACYPELVKMSAQKKFNSRAIEIVKLDLNQDQHCHMVILSSDKKNKFDDYLKRSAGKNVLVVQDNGSITKKGCAINLFKEDNKVKFEINLSELKCCGLKVSNQLEQLASNIIR